MTLNRLKSFITYTINLTLSSIWSFNKAFHIIFGHTDLQNIIITRSHNNPYIFIHFVTPYEEFHNHRVRRESVSNMLNLVDPS